MSHELRRAPRLSARADVLHGFTTRFDGGGQRMDLGTSATSEAWRCATELLGMPGAPVARVRQVHGAVVHVVDEGGVPGDGDALVTERRGLVLAVRMADCVPVFLVLGRPAVAIGAAHAGWRGVAAGVLSATVRALQTLGPDQPIHAVIGPAICGAHYEVGEEVIEAICASGVPESAFVARLPSRPRPLADVRSAARWQLSHLGFDVDPIERLTDCTFEDPDLWSHRRDGSSRGTLAGLLAMVP